MARLAKNLGIIQAISAIATFVMNLKIFLFSTPGHRCSLKSKRQPIHTQYNQKVNKIIYEPVWR